MELSGGQDRNVSEGAERQELFIACDEDLGFGSDSCTQDGQVVGIAAGVGRDRGRDYLDGDAEQGGLDFVEFGQGEFALFAQATA